MPRLNQTLEPARLAAHRLLTTLHTLQGGSAGAPLAPERFFPVQLRKVVSDVIGWQLEEVETVAYSYGHIQARCDFDKRTIFVSTSTARSPGEANFTLAHEIGHAVLHEGKLDRVVAASKKALRRQIYQSAVELEANAFAAELLMPGKAMRNQFRMLFGSQALWMGSRVVREALRAQEKRYRKEIPVDREKAAEALAAFKPEGAQQSLADFFGVTPAACGFQIRTLSLLVP